MYRYFTCVRDPDHITSVLAHASGAYAAPLCSLCSGPTVLRGEGKVPMPPTLSGPEAVFGPATEPLTDEKLEVLRGTGNHARLGRVDYYLKKNEGQQDAILTVQVGAAKSHKVRFHSALLTGNTSDSRVNAPGGTAWMVIEPKSDQMTALGATLTNPPAMDMKINLTVKIGTPLYGLVHIIAGHHDDLRTLTGAGVVQITIPGEDAAAKKQQRKMEQYRSFMAVQAGLQMCLSPSSLQAIYKIDVQKWMFIGEFGGKCMLAVAQKNGPSYDITTLYLGAPGGVNAVLGTRGTAAWKRRGAKLPPGW